VLPVLLHGDAAFAGQGVVAETLNLSQLRGYRTGGTVHVIINNQVGFTTGPSSSRSSQYATDVAKGLQVPIFHVNGDDPEACVRVAELAYEFRKEFHKDVVVDMVCYRRRGHNEGDDPSMTQPLMYDIIDRKRSVRKLYTEALVGRGDITLADAEEALKDYRDQLERAFAETHDAQDSSKPQPVFWGSFGSVISVTISSSARSTDSASWKKSRAATVLVPDAEATRSSASNSIAIIGSSAAGSACDRLPPIVPRLRIARCATCRMASLSTGKCRAIAGEVST